MEILALVVNCMWSIREEDRHKVDIKRNEMEIVTQVLNCTWGIKEEDRH